MAKIVKLTYGTHGKSKEYTYITNGNPRNGQVVQPSVRHKDINGKQGKVFGTTGIIQHTYSATSAQGKAEQNRPLATLYTSAELGMPHADTGTIKAERGPSGWAVPYTKDGRAIHFVRTTDVQVVRNENVERRGDV